MWLVVANLCQNPLFVPVRIGRVMMFLYVSNKTSVILCSSTFKSLYAWTLKGQSPENGLSYISGHRQRAFSKGAEPECISIGNRAQSLQ